VVVRSCISTKAVIRQLQICVIGSEVLSQACTLMKYDSDDRTDGAVLPTLYSQTIFLDD
jgi:hypothetical protein